MRQQNEAGVAFRIRKGLSIGEPDAESDQKFLSECFVETADYEKLVDIASPQRIIVGRTGSGKSALLYNIKNSKEHVIEILPEDLSLNFISNSDIIQVLERAGVKLDIFYTLLWKHVFTVELLKAKYDLITEEKTKHWLNKILGTFKQKNQAKERALGYIAEWGDKFWEETEYRIKEVTQKLENNIKTQMGGDYEGLALEASYKRNNSKEIKSEFVHKAQRIVNNTQVKALSDVVRLLAEDVFEDPQQKYYVVIDKLDENWVDNDIRYRLIRALIETVKSFKAIPSIKIIVALRADLIRSVFDNTRDAGFQEEKYQSLFLSLRWYQPSLIVLINNRITKLISEQYTTKSIDAAALFPESIGKTEFYKYLFSRTMYRPRDAIDFVNLCLDKAEGKGRITVQIVRDAEIEYSAKRIDALCYEWIDHYPEMHAYFSLLEKMPSQFKLSAFTKERIDEFALKFALEGDNDRDPVIRAAYGYLNGHSPHSFIITLTKSLFTVGVFGLKPDTFTGVLWVHQNDRSPTDGQIKPSSTVHIHPMLWARLGITEVTGDKR